MAVTRLVPRSISKLVIIQVIFIIILNTKLFIGKFTSESIPEEMKKLIVILFLMLPGALIYGQEKTDSVRYCEIIGYIEAMDSRYDIMIDSGQYVGSEQIKGIGAKDPLEGIYDVDKLLSLKKFSSMIGALNFMDSKGWDFVQAYSNPVTSSCHYILKKRK